jgi:hypothetical protein
MWQTYTGTRYKKYPVIKTGKKKSPLTQSRRRLFFCNLPGYLKSYIQVVTADSYHFLFCRLRQLYLVVRTRCIKVESIFNDMLQNKDFGIQRVSAKSNLTYNLDFRLCYEKRIELY